MLLDSPTADCSSFSNHLFEQLEKMSLNIKLYKGFEILPSSEDPHGIIYYDSFSLKNALSKVYKVLYDISREKALTSGVGPSSHYQNYCDYLTKHMNSKKRTLFISFIKNCCFNVEKQQYPFTFQMLISQLEAFLEETKTTAPGLSLQDLLKKKEILSAFEMLYQIHYSNVKEKLEEMVYQIKWFFLPYTADNSSESLGEVPPKIISKCKKYSILRRALLEALLPVNEKTTEFVKTYLLCPNQLLIFTDFLKTYLEEAEIKDRIELVDAVLDSLRILDVDGRFNLELINYILSRHLKEKTFLKDDETADSIIMKALENHKGALLEYIPAQWIPSNAKRKELINMLQRIEKNSISFETSQKLEKLITNFSF
ncbi:hypothetical protein H0X06_06865 [Candidatus Dependentiae bacterium]|nr:hypothetical protein [Candidatus Dependentiae bacterium]